MITAHCHCANIRLRVEKLKADLTSCNCSICHRYGALWAYYHPDEVDIREDLASLVYSWGEKDIAFHFCPVCGCVTHYTGIGQYAGTRVAINARMIKAELIVELNVRRFDGADSWTYLD